MPLKNYSSGMVACIAFAIATVTEPDVLIVDETLSVGDVFFQEKCEARIKSFIDSGHVTVLFVSHPWSRSSASAPAPSGSRRASSAWTVPSRRSVAPTGPSSTSAGGGEPTLVLKDASPCAAHEAVTQDLCRLDFVLAPGLGSARG